MHIHVYTLRYAKFYQESGQITYRNDLKNYVALVLGQLTFPIYNKIKNVNTKIHM